MKKERAIEFEVIMGKIYFIRRQKVMLDRDLALLYDVKTFNLNKAVRRNINRFPNDFLFRLTKEEYKALRFQTGILSHGRHSKFLPFVFTQEGVAMLSSVLHSNRATDVNIAIMRAFVQMRQALSSNRYLAEKLKELENKLIALDYQIEEIVEALRGFMNPPEKSTPKIGYKTA